MPTCSAEACGRPAGAASALLPSARSYATATPTITPSPGEPKQITQNKSVATGGIGDHKNSKISFDESPKQSRGHWGQSYATYFFFCLITSPTSHHLPHPVTYSPTLQHHHPAQRPWGGKCITRPSATRPFVDAFSHPMAAGQGGGAGEWVSMLLGEVGEVR